MLPRSPGQRSRGLEGGQFGHEIVYEGPDAAAVPDLVAQLVEELRERNKHVPPLVRAAMAHLNLVMIHPFRDGNGRMARCLQTLVLAREGILAPEFCSIEEYLGRNTQAYYDVLAQVGAGYWQPHNDARPWIRFCLTAHYRQARTILRRFNEGSRLWQLTEHLVQQLGLPDRVIPALWDAACGFRVRNSTYRSMVPDEDVSEQVASRDLKLLVDNDLLVPFGSKRGRFYMASNKTKRLRAKAVEARLPIEDPFAELPRDQAATGTVSPP